jgi:hypothetical protein
MRNRAKASLKKLQAPWKTKDGVKIYHVYDGSRQLSYWDDFAFVLGSQKVVVTWTHPRLALFNAVEELAHDKATEALGVPDFGSLLDKSDPIYKKVGKSRKKAIYYRMAPTTPSFEAWYQKQKEIQKAIYAEDTLSVRPHYRTEQWNTGRNVSICYPVELLNETDIKNFAAKIKAHMKGEINLFAGLEDYQYTTADYRREHPEEFE